MPNSKDDDVTVLADNLVVYNRACDCPLGKLCWDDLFRRMHFADEMRTVICDVPAVNEQMNFHFLEPYKMTKRSFMKRRILLGTAGLEIYVYQRIT